MERNSILLPRPGNRPSFAARSLTTKLGTGAFLFFLIKGLAWLLVPLLATWLW